MDDKNKREKIEIFLDADLENNIEDGIINEEVLRRIQKEKTIVENIKKNEKERKARLNRASEGIAC